jgi:hypothetical protein
MLTLVDTGFMWKQILIEAQSVSPQVEKPGTCHLNQVPKVSIIHIDTEQHHMCGKHTACKKAYYLDVFMRDTRQIYTDGCSMMESLVRIQKT